MDEKLIASIGQTRGLSSSFILKGQIHPTIMSVKRKIAVVYDKDDKKYHDVYVTWDSGLGRLKNTYKRFGNNTTVSIPLLYTIIDIIKYIFLFTTSAPAKLKITSSTTKIPLQIQHSIFNLYNAHRINQIIEEQHNHNTLSFIDINMYGYNNFESTEADYSTTSASNQEVYRSLNSSNYQQYEFIDLTADEKQPSNNSDQQ